MGLFNFSQFEILTFLIVFIRISTMIIWFPIFGDHNTPALMKILFSFVIALIIYPIVKKWITNPVPNSILALSVTIGFEISLGLLIGIVARCVFYAVNFASQIVSFQMGFGMVTVIDPNTSDRVSIVNQFQALIATLLFLLINAHHVFFEAIIWSYQQVPPGSFSLKQNFLTEILSITSTIFTVGFKMSAPIAIVLLVTNAGLGVLSRAVPQINVFMISFPLTIGIGFIALGLSIPLLVTILGREFNDIGTNVLRILKTI